MEGEKVKKCELSKHHLSNEELEECAAEEEDYIQCSRCMQQVVGPIMHRCRNCPYFVHQECLHLPTTLLNPAAHPHSNLDLVVITGCNGCPTYRQGNRNALGYKCVDCGDTYDVKCVLPHLAFISPLHPHTLEFIYVNESLNPYNRKVHADADRERSAFLRCDHCAFCNLPLFGPVFSCPHCKFYIHKSCAKDFPQQIPPHRPTHPPLLLTPHPPHLGRCDGCGNPLSSVTFHCQHPDCGLILHSGCATREATLKHQHIHHHHDLTFFPEPAAFLKCNACKGFTHKTPIYRCVECDFTLHKACIRFPSAVKDASHDCSLQLFSDFPHYTNLICSSCSLPISPNPGAYRCESGCDNFVLHLHCVRLHHQGESSKVVGEIQSSDPCLLSSSLLEEKIKEVEENTEELNKASLEELDEAIKGIEDVEKAYAKKEAGIKETIAAIEAEKKLLEQYVKDERFLSTFISL